MLKMKKFILLLSIFVATGLMARTPAEALIYKYENVKGAKLVEASGGKMVFARPVLKKYPIGPMSDDVEELVVLRMEKASQQDFKIFFDDFSNVVRSYIYYGKFEVQDGLVDIYVHLKDDTMADELVVYNPTQRALNSLSGAFPVSELLKLDKSKK